MAKVSVILKNGKTYSMEQEKVDKFIKKGGFVKVVQSPTKPDVVLKKEKEKEETKL